jgi:BirA family transcriptional regulator, biotin operon repressor / biotin---[acetyl-CoA-carboxylase] ligase
MPDDDIQGHGFSRSGSAQQAIRPVRTTKGADGGSDSTWFREPIRLGTVDSTNRVLADLAKEGAEEGTSVLATSQTAGRGRFDRRWLDAPGGSILCSVLFRPSLPPERWHVLPWLVTLAARDASSAVASVETWCKWPNDLVASDEQGASAGQHNAQQKLAGVLAEVVPGPGAGLVVGIGMNVAWPAGWSPAVGQDAAGIPAQATYLERLAGRPVRVDDVARVLLDRIALRYEALLASSGAMTTLMTEYRGALSTIGRLVRIELPGESFTGRALDVDDDGRLLVDVGACIRSVSAGDVVHLR